MQIILSVSYTEAHQQDQLNLFWDQTDNNINNPNMSKLLKLALKPHP